MMKRIFDLILGVFFGCIVIMPCVVIAISIRYSSSGPSLYRSNRVGRNNKIFSMPKFRSMRIDAPLIETNLMKNSANWITPIGVFLRKSSLDELPQIWSVIKGDMSIVGPRPALVNQVELNRLRTIMGIHLLTPGITGWAQVNGRDNISDIKKVILDAEYLKRKSILFDCYIIWLTCLRVFSGHGVSH